MEALAYVFAFDHPEQAGAASRDLARELDLTAQYTLDEKTILALALGVAEPGRGGRQAIAAVTSDLPNRRPIGDSTGIAEFFIFHTF